MTAKKTVPVLKKKVVATLDALSLLADVSESFGGIGGGGFAFDNVDYSVVPPVPGNPHSPEALLHFAVSGAEVGSFAKLQADAFPSATHVPLVLAVREAVKAINKARRKPETTRVPFDAVYPKLHELYEVVEVKAK